MAESEHGPSEPLSVAEVVHLFEGAAFPWWIAGGLALELFADRSWRTHDDVDVGVRRIDASDLYEWLQDWDVHIAASGMLTLWHGESLRAEHEQNNLWFRRTAASPWVLDLQIDSGNDEHWIYRRDETLSMPWSQAVLTSAGGVAFLAPEVQLLFKSKNVRPKDDLDAREVIPELDESRRRWLRAALPSDHPWHDYLDTP